MEFRGIFEAEFSKSSCSKRRRLPSSNSSASISTVKTRHSNHHRPDTALSTRNNVVIVSIVESRAREVCICKLDTANGSLIEIILHTDGHSYNQTLLELQHIKPDEILLHDGCREKILSKKIEALFSITNSRVLYISRQYFDQGRGAELLRKVVAGKVDADLIAKYIVLSGSYCLLRYIENVRNSLFPASSIRISFESGHIERMLIDRRTALHLELVSSTRNGQQKETLFGVINHTKTSVGARLLRGNILSPLTCIETISERLDIVEFLLTNNKIFADIVPLLQSFPDLDKLLTGLATEPRSLTEITVRSGIDTLIFIKHTVHVADSIASLLLAFENDSRQKEGHNQILSQQLLPTILATSVANFRNIKLQLMAKSINELISEETSFSKSSLEMRYQECFAVKPGLDGLLDVARKTYLQTVEEIFSMSEQLSKTVGFAVKVSFSASRGYHFQVPAEASPLPTFFIQAILNKRVISCSTIELNSLSDRANESISQALAITNKIVQNWLRVIREDIDVLFRLVDTVALVDMLTSFADVVALSQQQNVRPILKNSGALVCKSARHPVISSFPSTTLQGITTFKTNDIMIGGIENFMIITGPNGSGKTILIKQIALIVVLAQIGCFVPAAFVSIPIRDRILSRLSTGDDMENNMSTFSTEMGETAYILENLTDKSLVIIDELGRGTSTVDGISLAFSISEKLMESCALVLFITHFSQLTLLPQMYPYAKNIHMKTNLQLLESVASEEDTRGRPGSSMYVEFLHEVGSGPSDMQSEYGIVMSELCGFPLEVVENAREVRRKLGSIYHLKLSPSAILPDAVISITKLMNQVMILKEMKDNLEDSNEETRVSKYLQYFLQVNFDEQQKRSMIELVETAL